MMQEAADALRAATEAAQDAEARGVPVPEWAGKQVGWAMWVIRLANEVERLNDVAAGKRRLGKGLPTPVRLVLSMTGLVLILLSRFLPGSDLWLAVAGGMVSALLLIRIAEWTNRRWGQPSLEALWWIPLGVAAVGLFTKAAGLGFGGLAALAVTRLDLVWRLSHRK